MKKIAAAAAALLALIILFAGCTAYGGDTVTENGLTCYISRAGGSAFAANWEWDGDPENTDIYIPDTCGGAKIVSIGGYFGTGVPTPFSVRQEEDGKAPDSDAEPEKVIFTVHFGANIREIKRVGQIYGLTMQKNGSNVPVGARYYFVCDGENEKYFTKEGRVYELADDSLVEDIDYWDAD